MATQVCHLGVPSSGSRAIPVVRYNGRSLHVIDLWLIIAGFHVHCRAHLLKLSAGVGFDDIFHDRNSTSQGLSAGQSNPSRIIYIFQVIR